MTADTKSLEATYRVTFDFALRLEEPDAPTNSELKGEEDPILSKMRAVREIALMRFLLRCKDLSTDASLQELQDLVLRELVAEEVAFALDENLVEQMGVDVDAMPRLIRSCGLDEQAKAGLLTDYGSDGLRVFYSGVEVDLVAGRMERLG